MVGVLSSHVQVADLQGVKDLGQFGNPKAQAPDNLAENELKIPQA